MDYVVGSVAALISGNVTPNRPKKFKKALTPMKHQLSPNVTPKSELVEDRSIFLSPTLQKKKAIIKKSPKRIFENPDLDVTKEDEGNANITSPKADKVKKHLKDQLDDSASIDQVMLSTKTPKTNEQNTKSPSKKKLDIENNVDENTNESTKKKKKKKHRSSETEPESKTTNEAVIENENENLTSDTEPGQTQNTSPKKRKRSKSIAENADEQPDTPVQNTDNVEKPKKKKNKKNKQNDNPEAEATQTEQEPEKGLKKKKNKKPKDTTDNEITESVNQNAITNKDTDSEHESDNEIESEDENEKVLEPTVEESSDEEEQPKKEEAKKETREVSEDEIKRTIFVGNVPFSSKCKKEIKKIFSHYGQIETVRIRTVPVKDARVTPKLAVIKSELHPDRTTVNVYVKFADKTSVNRALAANNTVLNDHHLRVSRSDSTGAAHDPHCSVFVGNIPFALEDEGLRAKFQKCGEIESVRIIRDKKTNAGKGFGYVNFKSKDGVELALALTEEDLTIKNRILRVKRCTQFTQRKTGKFDNRQVGNQGNQWQNQGKQFGNGRFSGNQNDERNDGAYRRLMHKRMNQDGGEGPPNKRQNFNEPHREKKVRKEFVGMTAEKKKKQKFNKGEKKKKILSEILTKK